MHFIIKIYNDSLLKNSIYLMVANLLNLMLGFFFWVTATRYYTPHEVGTTSALLSSMFLISMISALGFHIAFVFYLPRDRKNANRIINSCMTSSITLSLIFSFIFILGLDIWAPPLKFIIYDVKSGILFAVVTTIMTVSGHISGAFIAGRRSSFHTTKEILFGLLKILPLQMLSIFGAIGIFVAWGIGLMVSVVIGFFLLSLVWKGYLPTPMLDPIIGKMAGYSVGNYLAEIFSYLPRFILPIMIMNMISTESTGFFFIALMVASLLFGIPQSISNSLLAESSEEGELWNKVEKSIKFNGILLFPGVFLFLFFGKFVLNYFNPIYAENASATLMILAIASLPFSVNTIFTAVRNAQKRVLSVLGINAAIAAITLVLAFPLVRSSGIEGAAFAYLVANTIVAMALVYKMKNLVKDFVSKLILSDTNILKGCK